MVVVDSPIQSQNIRERGEHYGNYDRDIGRDLVEYLREYAREKPEAVALWCFGIGFILGWKLKPW